MHTVQEQTALLPMRLPSAVSATLVAIVGSSTADTIAIESLVKKHVAHTH